MVKYNIRSLLQKKSMVDHVKYTYQDIENDTGIKINILSRMNSTPNYNISAVNLEKLCRYLNCTPNDLVKIYDDTSDYKLSEFKPNYKTKN